MLNIFVCEDDEQQRIRITKYIEGSILIENIDMEISMVTGNPKDIIDYVSSNSVQGIYFLDVDLGNEINGIALAAEIRKYDQSGYIIFITSHSEMSVFTFQYKVEAMDYIIKDNFNDMQDRIHQCIVEINKKHSRNTTKLEKNFVLKVNDRMIYLEMDKILFFETTKERSWIIMHAIDRQIRYYGKMKEIEGKLDNRFYRCHKSFIVNKDNIKEIDLKKKIIYMKNGEECLVSHRLIKGLC